MRVALMIDSVFAHGKPCGRQVAHISPSALSHDQILELQLHACSPEDTVDFFISDRDEEHTFHKIYRVGDTSIRSVLTALDAWRTHRSHFGQIGMKLHEPAPATRLYPAGASRAPF